MASVPDYMSLLVAMLVAWIGYWQFTLAREQFRLDLFEKRFAIFQSARAFLQRISTNGTLERNDLFDYRRDTQDATFLFGQQVEDYLRSLADTALELKTTKEQFEPLPSGAERSELCEKETQLLRDLCDESIKLKDVFAPYLRFELWSRRWSRVMARVRRSN
jgi:hypothetical protein